MLASALLAIPALLDGCARKLTGALRSGSSTTPGNTMMNGMMSGDMMGAATAGDMRSYMELFQHHATIRRKVEHVSGGVRTLTESDDPHIAALLQAHVSAMYTHLTAHQEVQCMSATLPVMFRNSTQYQRRLELTPRGVAVVETSSNPQLVDTIRAHAREVTGFVEQGMPAMMRSMMR